MDPVVNMHEAKTHLSKLVERVLAGEEIVIARSGRPAVRLVPYVGREAPREPGAWRGKLVFAEEPKVKPEKRKGKKKR